MIPSLKESRHILRSNNYLDSLPTMGAGRHCVIFACISQKAIKLPSRCTILQIKLIRILSIYFRVLFISSNEESVKSWIYPPAQKEAIRFVILEEGSIWESVGGKKAAGRLELALFPLCYFC